MTWFAKCTCKVKVKVGFGVIMIKTADQAVKWLHITSMCDNKNFLISNISSYIQTRSTENYAFTTEYVVVKVTVAFQHE